MESRVDYTRSVAATTSPNSESEEAPAKASPIGFVRAARNDPPVAEPSRATAFVWITTAVLTGAIVMAMELTAFRLYAPYFGNSIYVWGSMISVVMLALAVGYGLGGWIADRMATDSLLYLIVFGSGVYQLAIVFVMRAVLRKLWLWDDFAGPVAATAIIFGPPMTTLAMTSPFVVRLLARAGHVGATVGSVFALSTAGSIAGVLGTSFYLVPRFGTRTTLEILCVASVVIGSAGLLRRRKVAALLLLPLALLFLAQKPPLPDGILWAGESAYNHIAVDDYNGFRMLELNDARYFQTIEKLGSTHSGYYLDQFALGAVVAPASNLLVLGMGAGGSIQVSRAAVPSLEVDAVEIDPEVVRVAHEFFDLPKNDPKVRVHIADARPWLATHEGNYGLIQIDLFQGGPYVPFYLTTLEFFELVRSRMIPQGVLMVNVYDLRKERELLDAIGATLGRVFPTVEVLPGDAGNYILFAFAEKRPLSATVSALQSSGGPPWVRESAQKAAGAIAEFQPRPSATIFTDDQAPIEQMTRRMLLAAKK